MGSQPFQYATNMGLNVGGFVLGELGYSVPSSRPANDPTQITSIAGTAKAASPPQESQSSCIPEVNQVRPAASHTEAMSSNMSSTEPALEQRETPQPDKEKGRHSWQSVTDPESTASSHTNFAKPDNESAASSVFGDITVRGQGHYNPENDVILRMEAMTSGQVRFLNLTLWIWLAAAAGVLTWQFCSKLITDRSRVEYTYFIANVSIGSFLFLCINAALVRHLLAIRANWHKNWTPRRTKLNILVTIDLFCQWVMLLCFIVPNALMLRGRCWASSYRDIAWFVFARWTCWNTLFLVALITAHNSNISLAYRRKNHKVAGHAQSDVTVGKDKQPVVVADLPFWEAHWWKVILWICMECSIIATSVYATVSTSREEKRLPWAFGNKGRCFGDSAVAVCSNGKGSLIVSSIMVAFAVVYFLLYCAFLQRALKQLRLHSIEDFKLANTLTRIQMRLRLPAFAFFAFSMLLLWFVKPYSCDSIITTWLGMLPGQMSSTVLVICLSWVGSPIRYLGKGRPPLLQVWLQEYAWTKAEKAEKLAKRNASMATEDKAQIEKEPMFCVEAMLVCLYWSLLIYDFQESEDAALSENKDAALSIEDACSLFRPPMEAYEMFWEKSLDTKCLMAWNHNEIILVFRGTASLTNVVTDAQAWRTHHLPHRGAYWQRPKVHSGFDRLWRNNALNEKVISKLKELFNTRQVDQEDYQFYVTGHSLGGALATLAAYDIRHLDNQHGRDRPLTCITFGAPRTGNHSFAAEFNEMVPDSWNVINDQDLVARGGKFVWMYKRGGHRVIINKKGDLIVRPSPLEASLRILPLSGSVHHHLLTSYLKSIVSVLLAQFSKQQRLSGSMKGIVDIVRHNKSLEKLILDEAGLELQEMVYMARWGGYAPQLAQHHARSLVSASQMQRESTINRSESCGCCDAVSLWMEDTVAGLQRGGPGSRGFRFPNTKDGLRTEKERQQRGPPS